MSNQNLIWYEMDEIQPNDQDNDSYEHFEMRETRVRFNDISPGEFDEHQTTSNEVVPETIAASNLPEEQPKIQLDRQIFTLTEDGIIPLKSLQSSANNYFDNQHDDLDFFDKFDKKNLHELHYGSTGFKNIFTNLASYLLNLSWPRKDETYEDDEENINDIDIHIKPLRIYAHLDYETLELKKIEKDDFLLEFQVEADKDYFYEVFTIKSYGQPKKFSIDEFRKSGNYFPIFWSEKVPKSYRLVSAPIHPSYIINNDGTCASLVIVVRTGKKCASELTYCKLAWKKEYFSSSRENLNSAEGSNNSIATVKVRQAFMTSKFNFVQMHVYDSELSGDGSENYCMICFNDDEIMIPKFLPCGHKVVCNRCIEILKKREGRFKCPKCNQSVLYYNVFSYLSHDSKWTCMVCDNTNGNEYSKCVRCDNDRFHTKNWICPIPDCWKVNEENVTNCSKCEIERQFSKPERTIEQNSSLWSRFMSIFGGNEIQKPNIPINDNYDKGLQRAYQYLILKELKDCSIVNFEKPLIPRGMICKHFDALSDDGTQVEDDGLQYRLITEVLEKFCSHDYFSNRIFQREFPRILDGKKILCEIRLFYEGYWNRRLFYSSIHPDMPLSLNNKLQCLEQAIADQLSNDATFHDVKKNFSAAKFFDKFPKFYGLESFNLALNTMALLMKCKYEIIEEKDINSNENFNEFYPIIRCGKLLLVVEKNAMSENIWSCNVAKFDNNSKNIVIMSYDEGKKSVVKTFLNFDEFKERYKAVVIFMKSPYSSKMVNLYICIKDQRRSLMDRKYYSLRIFNYKELLIVVSHLPPGRPIYNCPSDDAIYDFQLVSNSENEEILSLIRNNADLAINEYKKISLEFDLNLIGRILSELKLDITSYDKTRKLRKSAILGLLTGCYVNSWKFPIRNDPRWNEVMNSFKEKLAKVSDRYYLMFSKERTRSASNAHSAQHIMSDSKSTISNTDTTSTSNEDPLHEVTLANLSDLSFQNRLEKIYLVHSISEKTRLRFPYNMSYYKSENNRHLKIVMKEPGLIRINVFHSNITKESPFLICIHKLADAGDNDDENLFERKPLAYWTLKWSAGAFSTDDFLLQSGSYLVIIHVLEMYLMAKSGLAIYRTIVPFQSTIEIISNNEISGNTYSKPKNVSGCTFQRSLAQFLIGGCSLSDITSIQTSLNHTKLSPNSLGFFFERIKQDNEEISIYSYESDGVYICMAENRNQLTSAKILHDVPCKISQNYLIGRTFDLTLDVIFCNRRQFINLFICQDPNTRRQKTIISNKRKINLKSMNMDLEDQIIEINRSHGNRLEREPERDDQSKEDRAREHKEYYGNQAHLPDVILEFNKQSFFNHFEI